MTRRPTILYAGTYERDYPRNQQIIRLLRACGCEVTEIHEPFWEHFEDKSRGLGGPAGALRAVLTLIRVYFSLIIRVLVHLRRVDAVAIGYIGQLDMLVLGTLSRLFGKPVLFNPLVTLMDTVVEDREMTSASSLLGRFVWLVDWVSLRIATITFIDTKQNAAYLEERFGIAARRICVVPVGADESVFHPADARAEQHERGLHVLFYGKMIPLHGVETILEAITALHAAGDTDITFEIIGSGQHQHLVERFVAQHSGATLVYRPRVAYRRLPQRIASADVVLGIFGSGEKAARVIPNKVFQTMAVGAAIITRHSPAVREVLLDEQSALLIPPSDPQALAAAIRRLRDSELRRTLKEGARDAFERTGSDQVTVDVLAEILGQLIPKPGSESNFGRPM